jgi:hypothetical protein
MFSVRYEFILTHLFELQASKAVPCLRRLASGVSPRPARVDPESVDVRFVVDRMTLGQVCGGQCDIGTGLWWTV